MRAHAHIRSSGVSTRQYPGGVSVQGEPILPPVPTLQARSRRSLDRLIRAGLDVLSAEGPEALTVAAVAQRAELAVGTVYRRFGSKERLLAALQFAFIQTVDADVNRHVERARRLTLDGRQRVGIAVRAVSRAFERDERLFGVFLMLGTTNASVRAEGTRASKAANERFRQSLDGVVVARPDRDAALDMAYRIVYAACAHRVTHSDAHESDRPMSWRRFHRQLAEVVQRYLLDEEAPATRR